MSTTAQREGASPPRPLPRYQIPNKNQIGSNCVTLLLQRPDTIASNKIYSMHIRLIILITLLLAAPPLFSQTAHWDRVPLVYDQSKTSQDKLTENELAAIRNLLRSSKQKDIWGCDEEENTDLINNIQFSGIVLAPGHKTFLVEAGSGCARGGQGANGAMWIVEFHGSKATLLATPDNDFNGWLYSVQPNPHSVYSDIVLGWHMGAGETGLTYFRFDGHFYQSIATASLFNDLGTSKGRIVPTSYAGKPVQSATTTH
jgi:hypothetical protein